MRQLRWLRRRHLRTELAWWALAAGADIVGERSWFDRIYQVYVVAIVAAATAASWAAVLNMVTQACEGLGAVAASALSWVLLLMPVAIFTGGVVRALRQPPLKLTGPDAAFLASGSFDPRALATAEADATGLAVAVISGFVAFALVAGTAAGLAGGTVGGFGTSMVAAGQTALTSGPPLPLGDTFAQAVLAVRIGLTAGGLAAIARYLGCLRLRVSQALAARIALGAGLLAGTAIVAALSAGALSVANPLALTMSLATEPTGLPAAISIVVLGLLFLTLIVFQTGPALCGLDLARAIELSGAYAAFHGVRQLALTAPDTYRELRRRYRVAHRRRRPSVCVGTGAVAVVAHALQMHLRQFEGLPRLLAVGALLAPASACMLAVKLPPLLLVSWMYLVFVSNAAIRELSLAFREDQRVRLVRDALPVRSVGLAVLDTLPALLATELLAIVALSALAVLVPGSVTLVTFALAAVLLVAFALAAAMDGIEIPYARRQPSCGMAVLGIAIAAALASLLSVQAVLFALVLCCLYLLNKLSRGI